ncbi:Retrovirus-related Pol polyprotein from transposon TNT 1-94 [Cardamine amara subsp. amara]|uniref:Retrovirus-related Pol polyprotein from transposon TNT 1-94 n=1 Tax=Cardamine amara subsp. amara TaxID=228776 RepID=A0ABD1BJ25_CARAN
MLAVTTGNHTDSWILDTRCSFHMTSNKEWFETYEAGNFGTVKLADDRSCSIVGVGQIKFRIDDGVIRTLTDVKHLPAVKKNLISLSTLHKNGFKYETDDENCVNVRKRDMTVMKGEITSIKVYRLLGNVVVGEAAAVLTESDSTALWHMRLGHIGEHGLAELHKRNLLDGLKSCKMDFCKFCVMGKQSKASFKTWQHTTNGLLDYVHSDVWRPTRE